MRHASFFSGVGGLDLGFHRAGIETVSLSEVDKYASAVLAERFVGVPNLGDILEVKADDIPEAEIWSGGFPCQDLSVAGKRAGFAGKRSSLAFTFLDLVEQRKPRWLLLENVPGLFSSNGGADFGRLISEMVSLGYGISWRVLDARYFGVAQRRRRVFIIAALNDAFGGAGAERAGEVLFECQGGCGHIEAGNTQGQAVTSGTQDGFGIAGAITGRFGKGVNSTIDEPLIISPAPNTNGVRKADGLARRLDNQQWMETTPAYGESFADTLAARDWKGGVSNQDIGRRGWLAIVRESNYGGYLEDETGATLRAQGGNYGGGSENLAMTSRAVQAPLNALFPVGLDAHRYRCCGNGVVAPVAEWIGRRIVAVDAKHY